MNNAMVQRGFADKTRIAYLAAVRGLAKYYHRSPHLLEAGTDIHTIQRLLGHRSISTTLVYFHLARSHLTGNTSPLDLLDLPN
jgi:site-specific recombinase XerC